MRDSTKFLFDCVCAETTFTKKSSTKIISRSFMTCVMNFETMADYSWLNIPIKNANTKIKS